MCYSTTMLNVQMGLEPVSYRMCPILQQAVPKLNRQYCHSSTQPSSPLGAPPHREVKMPSALRAGETVQASVAVRFTNICLYVYAYNNHPRTFSVAMGYRLDGRGSIPIRRKGFFFTSDRPWTPPSLLYNGYRKFFPRS
jgi:hypothetical protein